MLAKSSSLKGIMLMLVGLVLVTVLDASAKWLGAYYPTLQIAFARNLFALLPLIIIALLPLLRRSAAPVMRSPAIGPTVGMWFLILVRAPLLLTAQFLFFWSLKKLTLAEATALFFTSPLFITALAGVLLGEWAGPRRWAAVILGFIGVLLALAPQLIGKVTFNIYMLLPLGSSLAFSLAILLVRRIPGTTGTTALTIYAAVTAASIAAMLIFFMPNNWKAPVLEHIPVFLLLGLAGGTSAWFMNTAYRLAPAATLAPLEYVTLITAFAVGYFIWQEGMDIKMLPGLSLVIGAGLYIIWRESRFK